MTVGILCEYSSIFGGSLFQPWNVTHLAAERTDDFLNMFHLRNKNIPGLKVSDKSHEEV